MAAKQSERGAKGKSAPAGVKLGSALTLANAGEVAETLRGALAGGGKVTLDATAVGEVDLAGLQLICVCIVPGRDVEQIGGRRRGCEARLVLLAMPGVDDVNRLLSAAHPFDEERIDDRAFLGRSGHECAGMKVVT